MIDLGTIPLIPTNQSLKTVTFTGAAGLGAVGNVPLFTVTGQVLVTRVYGIVTTNLAGATATLALGVTGSTSLWIAATTATLLATTARIWASITPTATALALPAAVITETIIDANIVGTVAVAAITAGVLTVYVHWTPIGAGASIV